MNKFDIVVNKSELLATLNRVSIVIKEKDSSIEKLADENIELHDQYMEESDNYKKMAENCNAL